MNNLLKGTKNNQGGRLAPARTKRQDDLFKCRVDQGEVNPDGTYQIVVQQNGDPHGSTISRTTVDPGKDTADDVLNRLEAGWGKG